MLRKGLSQLLASQSDLEVCSEAGTATQALNLISVRQPDLVLADLSLPDKHGLELIKDIQVFHPGVPVLVISVHDESLYAERVLRAGGRGYVSKQAEGKRILEAVRQVLAGRIYVSETISASILEHVSGRRPHSAKTPLELLSDREFEVFRLLGQGLTTREVAGHLNLSSKTVEVHRANIKRRLKCRNGAEVVRLAIRFVEGVGS